MRNIMALRVAMAFRFGSESVRIKSRILFRDESTKSTTVKVKNLRNRVARRLDLPGINACHTTRGNIVYVFVERV